MAFSLNHVHLKTPDPKATADWYVQNLGATVTAETPNGGFRLDLHGLPLNVTDHIATQTHPQTTASSILPSTPPTSKVPWTTLKTAVPRFWKRPPSAAVAASCSSRVPRASSWKSWK